MNQVPRGSNARGANCRNSLKIVKLARKKTEKFSVFPAAIAGNSQKFRRERTGDGRIFAAENSPFPTSALNRDRSRRIMPPPSRTKKPEMADKHE